MELPEKLTPENVAEYMKEVNEFKHDHEYRHGLEDQMMFALLVRIAQGLAPAQALARAFVDNYDHKATRWYA
jgi:hypothetical protein